MGQKKNQESEKPVEGARKGGEATLGSEKRARQLSNRPSPETETGEKPHRNFVTTRPRKMSARLSNAGCWV